MQDVQPDFTKKKKKKEEKTKLFCCNVGSSFLLAYQSFRILRTLLFLLAEKHTSRLMFRGKYVIVGKDRHYAFCATYSAQNLP